MPLSLYLKVFVALLILTVITVAVSQFDFGEYNLIVAMIIAAIKATLVALYFMHLRYDNKIYMIIILTMADTQTRKDLYDYEMQEIRKNAIIYQQPDSTSGIVTDSMVTSGENSSEHSSGH